ncbi:hypothetical protein ACFVU3_28515 [Streptomyces sp. NPDC058052]|uniref:hypothetical protein n=1 Tax=Streptomyces sp. NPDC058052 TaxID=3346316 RepID=UPI0036E18542
MMKAGQVMTIPVSPQPGTGVYRGPGEVGKLGAFGSWLGREVQATDYLDPSWNGDWNPVALARWGAWKKTQPGRKVVLGIHMVPKQGGSLSAGQRGAYDAQYRELTRMLVKHGLGDSVIRLGYEPNNPSIGPWQGTSNPEGFKAMYHRAHGIMKSIAPNLRFDFNLAVGTSGRVTSWWTLYPGSAYVDIVGLNVYDVWWQRYSATPQQRWKHTLTTTIGVADHRAFAAAVGKPISYPEWGLYKRGDSYAGGGDNPYFVDRMAELTRHARYNAYFDLDWGGGVLDNFPNGRAHYKELYR